MIEDEIYGDWTEKFAKLALIGIALFLLCFLVGAYLRKVTEQKVKTGIGAVILGLLVGGMGAVISYFLFQNKLNHALALSAFSSVGMVLGYLSPLFLELRSANFEFAFAKRTAFKNQKSISKLVVFLAVASIALGVAVMEISMSIVYGFQTEIQKKVVGFGSHIQVGNYLAHFDSQLSPILRDSVMVKNIEAIEQVQSVSPFLMIPGMIQSKSTLEGIILKGVDQEYDWKFFANCLTHGRLPKVGGDKESREILISQKLANLLDIDTAARARVYFFNDKPKVRPVTVVGIYETGMEEFDAINVMADIQLLQRVMKWKSDEIGGYEIKLSSLDNLHTINYQVLDQLPLDLGSVPIDEIYPEIFDWLDLQHQNVWAILVLMIFIAVVNMTSVILIMIIEKTNTIGLLKSLGLTGFRVMKVFVYKAFFIILLGILFGNILGLGCLWLQDQFGLMALNQENYFVNVVPVKWIWDKFFLINLGVAIICTIFMFIPTLMITRISPVKAIKFD